MSNYPKRFGILHNEILKFRVDKLASGPGGCFVKYFSN